MNHHHHLSLQNPQGMRCLWIVHAIDHLNLHEMVPRYQRPHLPPSPLVGPLRQLIRVGPVERAVGLGVLNVLLDSVTLSDDPFSALRQDLPLLLLRELNLPFLSNAGRDIPEQLRHQGSQDGAHLLLV